MNSKARGETKDRMMYRKRPVLVEAWQNKPQGGPKPAWLSRAIDDGQVYWQGGDDPHYTIHTLEGVMQCNLFDWIIQGVKGEIYPYKRGIFEATYELVR